MATMTTDRDQWGTAGFAPSAARGFDGHFDWMCEVVGDSKLAYVGGDIVQALVESNQARYPDLGFLHFDITQGAFIKADL